MTAQDTSAKDPSANSPTDEPGSRKAAPTYSFKPTAFGAETQFRITSGSLEWMSEGRGGRLKWADVVRVRVSFDPRQMITSRWRTELWSKAGERTWFASASSRSLFDVQHDDEAYRRFVLALHARLQRSGEGVVFVAGRPPVLWWIGAPLAAATLLVMAIMAAQATTQGDLWLSLLLAAMTGYFGWELGRWFIRNRPRHYRPDAIPADLLPRPRG